MARKPIPEQTQNNLFIKSRRRCCLCFWLKGEDEVKKGQIAHIDDNNENCAEGNLVFLCLNHHDDFDSSTRLSKGLSEGEVKKWRDELYKEMQYRFRSIKTRTAELSLVRFKWHGPDDEFCAEFKLKNTGDVELRRVLVAIRLPEGVAGEIPEREQPPSNDGYGLHLQMPKFRMVWEANEERQDLFEPNGRVCIRGFPPFSIHMPGHAENFDALLFRVSKTKLGDSVELEYRIDAEDMPTVIGKLPITIPTDPNAFLSHLTDV